MNIKEARKIIKQENRSNVWHGRKSLEYSFAKFFADGYADGYLHGCQRSDEAVIRLEKVIVDLYNALPHPLGWTNEKMKAVKNAKNICDKTGKWLAQ
jgi:hypothetical protein